MANQDNDIFNHFFGDKPDQPQVVQDFSKLTPLDNVDELFLIIDCSGSMSSILDDAQGGVNSFIKEQKEAGEANITLVEFETRVDDPLYERIPINNAPNYVLRPRGMTALLDAIGSTLNRHRDLKTTGQRIAVIVTDGEENHSKEWTQETIKVLIKDIREEGWEIIFLAADEEAMAAGASYGIDMSTSVQFDKDVAGATCQVYAAASSYTSNLRGGMKKSLAVGEMDKFIMDAGEALKKVDTEDSK